MGKSTLRQEELYGKDARLCAKLQKNQARQAVIEKRLKYLNEAVLQRLPDDINRHYVGIEIARLEAALVKLQVKEHRLKKKHNRLTLRFANAGLQVIPA